MEKNFRAPIKRAAVGVVCAADVAVSDQSLRLERPLTSRDYVDAQEALNAFVRLSGDHGDQPGVERRAFEAFARDWGVFSTVPRVPDNPLVKHHEAPDEPDELQPVSGWKALSEDIARILRDLSTSDESPGLDSRARKRLRDQAARNVLWNVECWIQASEIHVIPGFDDEGVFLGIQGTGLMGLLAVELLHVYLQPELVAICDYCRSPYVATRQAAPSRMSYCDEHRGRSKLRTAEYQRNKRARVSD